MPTDSRKPLLEVRKISKRFPGVRALHEVDATLQEGEVLAVVGENGAGKSTLMKILAGVQAPDEGQILLDGQRIEIDSVAEALELGIALIHQELNLADNLDIGANVFLGREPLRGGLIHNREIYRQASHYLEMVGLRTDPRRLVSELTIGQQQLIEIAKALSIDARILIMDEPTSSLSMHEAEYLFEVIDALRKRGVSIIYISHRLGEVRRLADRALVLRDGVNAGGLEKGAITHDALVRMMVGRDVSQFYARQIHPLGEHVLEVRDLVTRAWPQHRINFSLRAGEIVGVAGLVGAGRTEMLRAIFGVDSTLAGQLRLEGSSLRGGRVADSIQRGLALVPEDRKQHGLILEMSVRENIGLAGLARNCRAGGFLNAARESADTDEMVEKLRIKTPSARQIVRYLSGGNQQKVVVGKWLALLPRVLLLDEPTRGIDVGAKEEIYRLMEHLAQQGVAILFVSSEMEEILGMSDRTLVMHEGAMTGELSREELSEEAIMQLATGGALVA